jgi:propanediol dehydratase small subunit
LRPGRAKSKDELIAVATELQNTHGAELIARFVSEAAEVYERRGLFKNRF